MLRAKIFIFMDRHTIRMEVFDPYSYQSVPNHHSWVHVHLGQAMTVWQKPQLVYHNSVAYQKIFI